MYTVSLKRLEGEGKVKAEYKSTTEYLEGVTDSFLVSEGTEVTFTAEPALHWDFDSWFNDADGKPDGEFVATIDGDFDIGVGFIEKQYILSMEADPEEGGTVSGTGAYTKDTEVDILAEPAEGWEFVNWEAPAGTFADANDPDTTFTMPGENVTVTANYDQIPWILTKQELDDFYDEDWNIIKDPVVVGSGEELILLDFESAIISTGVPGFELRDLPQTGDLRWRYLYDNLQRQEGGQVTAKITSDESSVWMSVPYAYAATLESPTRPIFNDYPGVFPIITHYLGNEADNRFAFVAWNSKTAPAGWVDNPVNITNPLQGITIDGEGGYNTLDVSMDNFNGATIRNIQRIVAYAQLGPNRASGPGIMSFDLSVMDDNLETFILSTSASDAQAANDGFADITLTNAPSSLDFVSLRPASWSGGTQIKNFSLSYESALPSALTVEIDSENSNRNLDLIELLKVNGTKVIIDVSNTGAEETTIEILDVGDADEVVFNGPGILTIENLDYNGDEPTIVDEMNSRLTLP